MSENPHFTYFQERVRILEMLIKLYIYRYHKKLFISKKNTKTNYRWKIKSMNFYVSLLFSFLIWYMSSYSSKIEIFDSLFLSSTQYATSKFVTLYHHHAIIEVTFLITLFVTLHSTFAKICGYKFLESRRLLLKKRIRIFKFM